jgi:predicted secreted protein
LVDPPEHCRRFEGFEKVTVKGLALRLDMLTRVWSARSLASSSSSERDDRRYPKENPDDERFRRRAAATSFDGTSLASDPYTACDLAAVKTGSFYSQSSTSLAYFLSEKSVIDYFELEPVVVKAKRGRFSKACRFLLSGRKKKTMESQHLGVQAA